MVNPVDHSNSFLRAIVTIQSNPCKSDGHRTSPPFNFPSDGHRISNNTTINALKICDKSGFLNPSLCYVSPSRVYRTVWAITIYFYKGMWYTICGFWRPFTVARCFVCHTIPDKIPGSIKTYLNSQMLKQTFYREKY